MSATVVARRIAATPARSASEAWAVIVALLTSEHGSAGRGELEAVAGIGSALISDEALRDSPAVAWGNGPRVRLYCLYGEGAVGGDGKNENSLPCVVAEGNWHLSLPCPEEDLGWVQAALKQRSEHITARDMASAVPEDDETTGEDTARAIRVNEEVFLRS